MIPTYDEALQILKKYNTDEFHLRHGKTVAAVMRQLALARGEDGEYWRVAGLLHDVDFELYPESHCVEGVRLLAENGVDEQLIRSAMSHGYGMTATPFEPQSVMEKYLFACDELTGLIYAASLIRPSKSVSDMEPKSVMKKFKTPAFAAGCSRDTIAKGAELLGITVDELVCETLEAMKHTESELDL